MLIDAAFDGDVPTLVGDTALEDAAVPFAGDFTGALPGDVVTLLPGDLGDLRAVLVGLLPGDIGDFGGVLVGLFGRRSWYSNGGEAGRASGEALRDRDFAGDRAGDRVAVCAGDFVGDLSGGLDTAGDVALARSSTPAPAADLPEAPDAEDARLELERSLLKLCETTSSGMDEVEISLLGVGAFVGVSAGEEDEIGPPGSLAKLSEC